MSLKFYSGRCPNCRKMRSRLSEPYQFVGIICEPCRYVYMTAGGWLGQNEMSGEKNHMDQTGPDLLLVNAPSRIAVYGGLAKEFAAIEPPVWACLIAQHCLDRGLSVAILDAEAEGLSIQETADRIRAHSATLTAFCIYGQQPSASTQCMPAAIAVADRLAADSGPTLSTLALGTHPSAMPFQTLKDFHFVCEGEGPQTIYELLRCLKGESPQALPVIPGLWFHGGSLPPRSTNITDLDRQLSTQAWHLLGMTKYRAHNWHLWTGNPGEGYASVQTSLGCPFKCTFCCINAPFGGAGIRYWSPERIVDQIEHLYHRYGISNIKIPDEMFCLNRKHVLGICNGLIDRGLGVDLNMWAYARVDTVNDTEMLDKMRRAGFRWLGIGVESGSKHVRDGVEKGKFDEQDIYTAIRRVQRYDIAVAANYIFGLPDDTMESMQETLDLACLLNTEWANFYCAMAYPGSPLHKTAREKGWPLPEGPDGPGWIGYAQHAYEALPLPTYSLTSAQVLDFRDEAFVKYFSRIDYQTMLFQKFGPSAVANVSHMLKQGKPKRKHRDQLEP